MDAIELISTLELILEPVTLVPLLLLFVPNDEDTDTVKNGNPFLK